MEQVLKGHEDHPVYQMEELLYQKQDSLEGVRPLHGISTQTAKTQGYFYKFWVTRHRKLWAVFREYFFLTMQLKAKIWAHRAYKIFLYY